MLTPPSTFLQGMPEDLAPRGTHAEMWDEVAHELSYWPVGYASSMIDYQHAYLAGAAAWTVHDLSIVLLNDHRPCGIWPLTLGGPDMLSLSSQGAPIVQPLFKQQTSERTIKKLVTLCHEWMQTLKAQLPEHKASHMEGLGPATDADGLSFWYRQALSSGAHVTGVRHELFADLQPDMATIRSGWRKSYRPLVNSGAKLWETQVMDRANASPAIWNEFRELHIAVAGRTTRPLQTWDLQYRMIQSGQGMLVHLRDPASSGRMVGGGFFQWTRDEGLYAVGAYDRTLFDKPLGHVVQARAIEEMKLRAIKWYRIGERCYASDTPRPNDKMLAISTFKEGFSSHMSSRILFSDGPANEDSVR